MEDAAAEPKWQPITAVQRRVVGVLLEKSKTTPSGYPMSLNAITTGCNQKSNRDPQMHLEPEEVEDALEELRLMGAVGMIEGGGRVPKYRHYAGEWFGVDRAEGAVLAELLLRGAQTVGELRGRAARMNKSISDVAALRPVLHEMQQKRLVVPLSAEGRGQMVTHGVYLEHEQPQASRTAAAEDVGPPQDERAPAGMPTPGATNAPAAPRPSAVRSAPSAPAPTDSQPMQITPPPSPPGVTRDMFNELQLEVTQLRAELARVRNQLEQLEDFVR